VEASNCWTYDSIVAFDLICPKEMMERLEVYDFIILHDIRSVKRKGYVAMRLKTTKKCLEDIYKDKHKLADWKKFCDWIKEVIS
jgi:hypothetical protein